MISGKVPIPEPRPAKPAETGPPPTPPTATPSPEEPETPAPPETAPLPPKEPATTDEPPLAAPEPSAKPDEAGETKQEEEKIQPDPRSTILPADKMPAAELACRERLNTLGVMFEEHKPEHDAEVGCSVPYPLDVKKLGASIELAPAAEMNCQMAEAAARFAGTVIAPAAKEQFGSELKSIAQASAYVCRPRHAGGKMSEHAFGNALDIASFTLADGTRIDVRPAPPEKEAKFLDEIRKAACGPFKTVLGPGSDPDHALHFHLDLEPRRNGGTFCQ
jgi:hypothetical protein